MSKTQEVKVVCAWCGEFLGRTTEVSASLGDVQSHGICQLCMEKMKDSFMVKKGGDAGNSRFSRGMWMSNQ